MTRTVYYQTPFMPHPHFLVVQDETYHRMVEEGFFGPGMNWYEQRPERVIDLPR